MNMKIFQPVTPFTSLWKCILWSWIWFYMRGESGLWSNLFQNTDITLFLEQTTAGKEPLRPTASLQISISTISFTLPKSFRITQQHLSTLLLRLAAPPGLRHLHRLLELQRLNLEDLPPRRRTNSVANLEFKKKKNGGKYLTKTILEMLKTFLECMLFDYLCI